jgi:hypothetical protein
MLTEKLSKETAQRVRVSLRMADDREITCETCASNDVCSLAFDPYNTDGDCLAMK